VTRYVFIVADFHHLLLAGLPAHSRKPLTGTGSAFLFEGVNIKEHDCVVLTSHLPSEGLLSGDVGTFVHIHPDETVYEVEFATVTRTTIAVSTVLPTECRPMVHRDINHVPVMHGS
jgi:hypothetical protein